MEQIDPPSKTWLNIVPHIWFPIWLAVGLIGLTLLGVIEVWVLLLAIDVLLQGFT